MEMIVKCMNKSTNKHKRSKGNSPKIWKHHQKYRKSTKQNNTNQQLAKFIQNIGKHSKTTYTRYQFRAFLCGMCKLSSKGVNNGYYINVCDVASLRFVAHAIFPYEPCGHRSLSSSGYNANSLSLFTTLNYFPSWQHSGSCFAGQATPPWGPKMYNFQVSQESLLLSIDVPKSL